MPASVHDVLHGPGQPLDTGMRTFMESRFGHDFGSVRLHTDGRSAQSARDISALAYTYGSDIVFDEGQFAPSTMQGQRLLAHELAHVVQQQGSDPTLAPKGLGPADSAHEREADTAAAAVLAGRAPSIASAAGPLIQRQCGGRPMPACPSGWESRPSSSDIGSAFGHWLGLQYKQSHPISSYLLVDWWLYSSRGKMGTIGGTLAQTDPYVLGALQARPDWARSGTQRTDILASDSDEVFEIKPVRGADSGPPQLAGYLASLRTLAPNAPDWMGGRPRNWHAGEWDPAPYLFPVPVGLTEFCVICTWADPVNTGVILYDLLCCDSTIPPPPIFVPKEAVDKLLERAKEFLQRLADDLGVVGKGVVAAMAAIAIAALVIALLPAEALAAIGAFFAAIGAAIGAAIAALLAELGLAATTVAGIIASAGALLSGRPAFAEPAPSPPSAKTGSTSGPPAKGGTASPGPGATHGILEKGIEILRQIEKSPRKDPQAKELKKLAAQLLPYLSSLNHPAGPPKPTPAPASKSSSAAKAGGRTAPPVGVRPAPSDVPGFGTINKIPDDVVKVHADKCIIEGISPRVKPGDEIYTVSMIVHYPMWSFAAIVKIKVIANDGRTLLVEYAEDWWVPEMGGGGRKGQRFYQSLATLGRCGTVHAVMR